MSGKGEGELATSAAVPATLTTREVLGIPIVRRMWIALIVSTFGDFLALFAVLSVVSFKMHATAEQITWIQIVSLVPLVLVGPLAGVFVDRWPLKPTMVCSDALRAGLTLLLPFVTHLWQFYLILALISVISTFFGPAQQCSIRTTVPSEGIMATTSIMQQASFVIRIISPAIAGMLVASFGAAPCYVIDSISFAVSALLMASLVVRRNGTASTEDETGSSANGVKKIWLDMRVGFHYILGHSGLLFVILALASAVFVLGCIAPLIAIYVRETLHSGTRLFGFINTMVGLGTLGGFIVVQGLAKRYSNMMLVLGGLGCMSASLLLIGLVHYAAVTLVAAAFVGLSVSTIMLPAQTMMQLETPEELMGRVSSTSATVVFGSQVLGLFLSGMLTRFISVEQVLMLGAGFLLTLIVMGRLFMHRTAVERPA